MEWIVKESSLNKDSIPMIGNKLIIGNGYMGYRGTLEEYTKNELVACNLAGLYDKVGDSWRETVNAPNGLFTELYCDGVKLDASMTSEHIQSINIKNGVHSRNTVYRAEDNNVIKVSAERFASMENMHLICMKYMFECSKACNITINTGIDGDIWDINGPHLENYRLEVEDQVLAASVKTHELSIPVTVAEIINSDLHEQEIIRTDKSIFRKIELECKAGSSYEFTKFVSVYTGNDLEGDIFKEAVKLCKTAKAQGYHECHANNERLWKSLWKNSDVVIEGDDDAQLALRYSIYQLLIIAPYHTEKASIPARGLSGQVYKGAVFWDTEMFMLPFFIYTNPQIARNLIMYRYHTLDGARRKASEYGFRGAFYAWESQDTGDDACTLFNITDVFTSRPMRTYFRDKQVHISADIVYAIWQYYTVTGDESILMDGGAEVILECARFFYSYSHFKPEKNRYEILDVTGPDEYHERVNNNAFTNRMVKYTIEIALKTLELLKEKYNKAYFELLDRIQYEKDMESIKRMNDLMYMPQPDALTALIEQFDGYDRLEDASLEELKGRIINHNEYLGGGNGLATTTKILKQGDVVLMLNLFKDQYSKDVKKANWEYYEPRTEHGSSLSSCVYALVASDIGYSEWAYEYFMKTATIDLTGKSKQFVGTLYIGGTHPAANGGAWMAAVLGFAGLNLENNKININPSLPPNWNSLKFCLSVQAQKFDITVTKIKVVIFPHKDNWDEQEFEVKGQVIRCGIDNKVTVIY